MDGRGFDSRIGTRREYAEINWTGRDEETRKWILTLVFLFFSFLPFRSWLLGFDWLRYWPSSDGYLLQITQTGEEKAPRGRGREVKEGEGKGRGIPVR